MFKEENEFSKMLRAQNGGTKVNAMLEYRQMKKTNTPFTRAIINETVEGLSDKWRDFYEQ